jgi:hypothetical protein
MGSEILFFYVPGYDPQLFRPGQAKKIRAGKAYEFRLVYPDGRVDTLLRVSRYNFHWQLDYRLENPIPLEPGMTTGIWGSARIRS